MPSLSNNVILEKKLQGVKDDTEKESAVEAGQAAKSGRIEKDDQKILDCEDKDRDNSDAVNSDGHIRNLSVDYKSCIYQCL